MTTTVAVVVGPAQPFALGVIVKVTVMGAKVVFVNDPLIVEPAPLAGMPVTVATLFLTHVYVVPATGPLNTIGVIADPEQIVCVAGVAVAVAVGNTVTVAVMLGPVQVTPAFVYVGVIVKVTVIVALVVLFSVPDILPVPLFAIPVTVTVLSLIQLNTVPATLPVSTIVVIAVLLQIDCETGLATAFGIGFTTTVAVIDGPVQVTPALV